MSKNKRVFLLCRHADVIQVIIGDSYDDVYDDTVGCNDSKSLVEIYQNQLADIAPYSAAAYWRNTKKQLLEKYSGKISDINKSRMNKWIHWWGNGGGMYSIECAFQDAIIKESSTYEDLLMLIENHSYFENGTAILFADVIQTMLYECVEVHDLWRDDTIIWKEGV